MIYESIQKIKSNDGHTITLHIFSPTNESYQESKCDGVILAVHGLAEHFDRYRNLAAVTCAKNKIFAIFDLRGHGKLAKLKGHIENLDSLILDIILTFNSLKSLFSQIPKNSFALFGHSLGGLLVTYSSYILKDEVKKIYLSAPGYATKEKIPQWKKIVAHNISNFLPKLSVPIGFDYENISNNSENNLNYKNDPLVFKSVTTQFGKVVLDATQESLIQNAIENVTAHATFLLPTDDKVVDESITKKFIPLFKIKPDVFELKGSGHEAFNETKEFQQIAIAHYEKWLEKI